MKNIQFSSRATDLKVLIALLCAGLAAFVGFCVKPPPSAISEGWICLFDATICAVLGILVWAAFHLCDFQHFSGIRLMVTVIGSIIVWALLVIGLMIVIRHLIGDYDLQFAVPNGMKL